MGVTSEMTSPFRRAASASFFSSFEISPAIQGVFARLDFHFHLLTTSFMFLPPLHAPKRKPVPYQEGTGDTRGSTQLTFRLLVGCAAPARRGSEDGSFDAFSEARLQPIGALSLADRSIEVMFLVIPTETILVL